MHPLTRLWLLLLVFCVCGSGLSVASVQAASQSELAAAFEQALHEGRTAIGAPGATAFVLVPGVEAWSGASGLAEIGEGRPMQADDQLRIASVSKLFVATVALQLVQEGWLRLDQTVEEWLPGLLPDGSRITVQMLLQHRSGLPDYLTNGMVEQARRSPERVWSPQELVQQVAQRRRLFAPGQGWSYSNTNYILLGMIIERVTSHSLEHELQTRIIEHLQLSRTQLAPASAEVGSLAHGYVRGQDYSALNMSLAWAAGGINSSAADLGRFSQALFWGELLDQEHLGLMQQFVSTGGWGSPDLAYGLGLMRRTLPANNLSPQVRLALGHTGALSGYRSSFWYLPESGITIVVLVNRFEAEPNRIVTKLLEALAAHGLLH